MLVKKRFKVIEPRTFAEKKSFDVLKTTYERKFFMLIFFYSSSRSFCFQSPLFVCFYHVVYLIGSFFLVDSRLIFQTGLDKHLFPGSLLISIAVYFVVDKNTTCIAMTEPCDDSTDFGIAPANRWSSWLFLDLRIGFGIEL